MVRHFVLRWVVRLEQSLPVLVMGVGCAVPRSNPVEPRLVVEAMLLAILPLSVAACPLRSGRLPLCLPPSAVLLARCAVRTTSPRAV